MAKMVGYPLECFEAINKVLAEESDRARILLVAGWIDEFLKVKLMNEYSKGNSRVRVQLFSANGPFATFSGKVNMRSALAGSIQTYVTTYKSSERFAMSAPAA